MQAQPFDALGILAQGAAGKYQPPPGVLAPAAAPPQAQAAAAPAPLQAQAPAAAPPVAAVPPPSSPQQEQFDPIAALQAGAKGQFKPTVQIPDATAGASSVSTPVSSEATPDAGPLAQIGSGLAQGAVGLPNTLANLPIRGINALFGTKIPQFGTNPFPVQATSQVNKDLQAAGSAVGSLAPMAMGGAALEAAAPAESALAGVGKAMGSVPASTIAPVAAGGAAGQQASDTLPANSPWKSTANVLGNLAGAGGVAALEGLAGGAAKGTGNLLGQLGLGGKTDYSEGLPAGQSIGATPAQAALAVGRVRAAGGPGLEKALNTDPLMGLKLDLEDKLQGNKPLEAGETGEEVQAKLNALKTSMPQRLSSLEVVPGERPTTVQVAPTGKLQALDKAARINPEGNFGAPAFQEADAAKNAAFVAHLEQASPGITSKLGDAFVEKAVDNEDAQKSVEMNDLPNVKQATEPLTGNVQPDVTGSLLRTSAEAQHAGAKANTTDTFWSQVNPNLTHPVIATKALARTLLGDDQIRIPPNSPPELLQQAQEIQKFAHDPQYGDLHPLEQKALERVAALPDNIPYRGTAKLLSGLGADKAQLMKAGLAQSPTMMRMRMLEGSLQDSMSGQAQTDMTNGRLIQAPPESAENGASLAAARQQSAIDNQTFRQGPVGAALAKTGYSEYKMPLLAQVTKTALSGDATEPQRVGAWLQALHGDPNGPQILHDALVSDANAKGVIKPNGEVDLKRFGTWMTGPRQQSVAQFPGLTEQFQNAAQMQQHLDEQRGIAVQAIKDFNSSVASKFIGQDAGVAVHGALKAGDRGQQLSQIQSAVAGNPGAEDALRAHVVDETVKKFTPEWTAPGGQLNGKMRAQSFRQFISDYKPGLRKVLGGQGMQNFDAVRAGLQRAQDASVALPGSQTTPLRLLAQAKALGSHGGAGMGAGMMGLLGEHVAESAGSHGIIGIGAGMGGQMLISALKSAALHNTNDLVNAMMLHPEFARSMLQTLPPGQTMTQALANRMAQSIRTVGSSYLTRGLPPNGNAQN